MKRIISATVVLLLFSIGLPAQEVPVYLAPFRNDSGNAALDALGQVLIRDLSLTVALLEDFSLTEAEEEARVRIVTEIGLDAAGSYVAAGSVIREGEEVVREEARFDSVFDVFDTGGEIGERMLSAYTNRELEFAALTIRPTSRPDSLEILLDGQSLSLDSLNLDRVLAGEWELEARLAGEDPFFRESLQLEDGDQQEITLEVPSLTAEAFRGANAERLGGFLIGGSNGEADGPIAAIEAVDSAGLQQLRSRFGLVEVSEDEASPVIEEALEQHRLILGGFTLPRLRPGVITVDGEPEDWRSVPSQVESLPVRGTGNRIVTGRFSEDRNRFFGYLEVENFEEGDGLEVTIRVPVNAGGSEGGILNITMANSSGSAVYLAAYMNPRAGTDNWSTAYESGSAATFTGDAFEFSIPVRAMRFSGVESNQDGIPERFTLDVEVGVTLETGGRGFDYDLYGSTGRQSFRPLP